MGLGLGLVTAPVVVLVAPDLMPGFLIVLTMLLPLATLRHERSGVHRKGLAWSLPLRVPGTAVGVWLVATLSDRALGLGSGVALALAAVPRSGTSASCRRWASESARGWGDRRRLASWTRAQRASGSGGIS